MAIAILGATAFVARDSGAQTSPAPTLQSEIAQVEESVDEHYREALTQTSQVYPGSPEAVVAVGKVLFFDKNLSVNGNTACAFCHTPETGYQGGSDLINRTIVDQPGSVRTRYSLRKPPSAAYAAFSPPIQYPTKTGQAKCANCFIGGNFWDLRATGLRLGNPAASQAQGSPVNPTEMANLEPACVVRRISQQPYRTAFENVLGPRSFDIQWPANVDALCSSPNNNPLTRIGSEVPGPNVTPWIVPLSTADRVRVQDTFDLMARAIAAFEASPEVSPFSSKFDAFLDGKATLSPAEMRGYTLFNGAARCNDCHVDAPGDPRPLFTDNTTSNLGIPKNPSLAYYSQTTPDQYGYVVNPEGQGFVDLGVGGYLRSPENGNAAWRALAPSYDGRFRTVTVRNVDKRPNPGFVKAYGQNGYFKSLKEIVHFYNTRDVLPHCAVGSPGEKATCWPVPEIPRNLNTKCCNLGLTDQQEDDIVSFLGTLSDGYFTPTAVSSGVQRPKEAALE
ncbi:cytochrome c peroxidase [Devosia sp.]|uniref:cytochrome-c peroxidase n=1 Tax=Devosia sp. TaxID=1871048 RepID=UPI00262E25F2|nr:cytochrome c peroxidase [Devosia sp.]